jgi:hypothetical protein
MVLRKSSVPSSKEGQQQVAVVSAYLRPPFLHRHKNKKWFYFPFSLPLIIIAINNNLIKSTTTPRAPADSSQRSL